MKNLSRKWGVLTLLLLLSYLTLISTSASILEPALKSNWIDRESEELRECFDNYKGFRDYRRVKIETLAGVCGFVQIYDCKYIHHSDCRDKQSSHVTCDALDFRCENNTDLDDCTFYFVMSLSLISHLSGYEELRKFGAGIYPADQKRMMTDGCKYDFFHVDNGNNKSPYRRWSRYDGEYLSIWEGLNHAFQNARYGTGLYLDLNPEYVKNY